MPKVHYRKARKDYPDDGIKKGEQYYTWSLRIGRGGITRRSKTQPRASQLTTSEYLSQAYSLEEQAEDINRSSGIEDIVSVLEDITCEVESLGNEQEDKYSNMESESPGLVEGDVGQLIQGRANCCQHLIDELNNAIDQLNELLSDEDDEDLSDKVSDILGDIDWTWEE